MNGISGLGLPPINFRNGVNSAAAKLIQNKDTDDSGTLSIGEFAIPEKIFDKIDINSDGQIDKNELTVLPTNRPFDRLAEMLIKSKDTNDDGTLNPDELGVPEDVFETIDTNQDTEVDKAELVAYLQTPRENTKPQNANIYQTTTLNNAAKANQNKRYL